MCIRDRGKQASVKVAAGPDAAGRNWKKNNVSGILNWIWQGRPGEPIKQFMVIQKKDGAFDNSYWMTVKLEDGSFFQSPIQKAKPTDWFKRAAEIYAASQTALLDFSDMPEKWKRLNGPAPVKTAAANGWSAVFTALDADMPSFNTKTVTDWNKVYKRMKKEGVKDAGAAAHFYFEYRAKRMGLEEAAETLASEGVKPPSGYGSEKKASAKTAGGSGAANAAFLRQSPLKNKVLQAVAKHYGVSVSVMESELTDPDAEAVYEYIGNDRALQMQVYREFKAKGF